jgi:hypothetical protein
VHEVFRLTCAGKGVGLISPISGSSRAFHAAKTVDDYSSNIARKMLRKISVVYGLRKSL